MDWKRVLKDYEGFLKLEKGLSPNSIEAYLRDVEKLIQYLEIQKIKTDPEGLSHEQLHGFLVWISELGLSPASQARTLSALKAFYKYLLLEDLIGKDPTVLLEGPKLGRKLPEVLSVEEIDLLLSYIDLSSPEGREYLAAMTAAANYAFANRQVLAHGIRLGFEQVLAGKVDNHQIFQVYDVAHNMARIETHLVDGRPRELCVHRKGATRAFGPGSPELPPAYRDIGQPVLVPGSMGTGSWVLLGTQAAMEQTFGSTCHGAGRRLSRTQARKRYKGVKLRQDLEQSGILVRAGSMSGLAEEAPRAYKDVDRVVDVVHGAGIATKVAKLVPLAVIKG